MVGYDPTTTRQLSTTEYSIAGAVSGCATRLLVQPFDVLKIRFQLQNEPIARTFESKYQGLLQASRTILREEGALAFWKGHVPAQCLSAVYGVGQFLTFEMATKAAWKHLPQKMNKDLQPVVHFVCGGFSGCAATFFSHPFDVIRTRLVAQAYVKAYKSMSHGYKMIWGKDGIRGFYRGLIPALSLIAPQTAFQFAYYSTFRKLWKSLIPSKYSEIGGVESLLCGSAAGLCAKATVYPLDVVKKRIQIQGFEHGRCGMGRTQTYYNLRQCVRLIFYQEGPLGFFKGLSPSLLKAVLSTGVNFFFYEQTCNFLRKTSVFR